MRINFIGIGSAWNTKYGNTSAYIKKDKKMLLIDCGESVFKEIVENDLLSDVEELYLLISHTHTDHVGSISTLIFYAKYNKKILNRIVLPSDNEYINNLKELLRIVDITTEVEYVDAECLKENFAFKKFEFLKATHVESLPCYCFVFEDDENLIYYSADNNNIGYIKKYLRHPQAQIYTEVCNTKRLEGQHLLLQKLEESISDLERKKVYLMHINEEINIDELKRSGFNIPVIEKQKKYTKLKKK